MQLPADPDRSTEALVRQLYGLGKVRRAIERHALAGLGTQGFHALAAIDRQGPLRVSDVAQCLGVDSSVASRQIAALTSQGYVERSQDERDRRAQRVAVAAPGRDALHEAHRRMVAAFSAVLAGWSDEDVARLADGLERLREDFLRLSTDPTAADEDAV
jgi:DNA-binding MarR family transcriptional regulator